MSSKKEQSTNTTNTGVIVKYEDKSQVIPIQTLLAALGLDSNELPTELCIFVQKNGAKLVAACDPRERDFPGITVGGFDSDQNELFLAEAELPNNEYPHSVSTRLYAGYSSYETDAPIAIVTHDIQDREKLQQRASDPNHPVFNKIVHVDTDVAQYLPWREAGELPEHAED